MARGQITITEVQDGITTIVGYLTNESHVVAAASNGSGYSLTSAGGTFKVYEGITDRTTASSFSGGATKNGLTLSIGASTGIYTLSGSSWVTDNEYFDLSATYGGTTITKRYVISKSKTGVVGDTGRGISSIVKEFYLSTSKTTQTGGTDWSTTMPTWEPGKYVWTRDFITYTSGSPATETTTPQVSNEWEAANYTVPLVPGTQIASTSSWTGTAPFASLTDGQQITYWLPYASTSTSVTLNLTLSGGGTTGVKNCYYSGTTRITTHYGVGNAIRLIYRSAAPINGTTYEGWWADANYDTNTYDRTRYNRAIIAKSTIAAGWLIVADSTNTFYPLKKNTPFQIGKPLLYAASNIAIGASGTNNYLNYPSGINLRTISEEPALNLTPQKLVYIKGTLSGDIFTTDTTTLFTDTPVDDGSIYMLLGQLYTTSYQITLFGTHELYSFNRNGVFKLYLALPEWLEDWDSSVAEVGETYIASPQIYIGETTPTTTGIMLGIDKDGNAAPNIFGYNEDTKVFEFTKNYLELIGTGTNRAGLSVEDLSETGVRFWAGDARANKDIAPFRVTQDGTLYANNAFIEGTVGTPYAGMTSRGFPETVESLTNLVSNGNFENINGWTSLSSTSSVTNNTLINTGNGTATNPRFSGNTSVSSTIGNKYYIKIKARVTNTICTSIETSYGGQSTVLKTSPIKNEWYDLSTVITATSSGAALTFYHVYATAGASNLQAMESQYVLVIDLTTAFGTGNEPTAAQMDEWIETSFDGWFSGTQEAISPQLWAGGELSSEINPNFLVFSNGKMILTNNSGMAQMIFDPSATTNQIVFGDKVSISWANIPDAPFGDSISYDNLESALKENFTTSGSSVLINGLGIAANSVKATSLDVKNLTVYYNDDPTVPTFTVSEIGEVTIKGNVSSYDYVVGESGWNISKDGSAEFNNATVRGNFILPDAGLSNAVTVENDVRLWAGKSFDERDDAPFRVYEDGSIYATLGTFLGVFSGTINIGDIIIEDTNLTEDGYASITFVHDNDYNPVYISASEVYLPNAFHLGDNEFNAFISDSLGIRTYGLPFSINNSEITVGKNIVFPNYSDDNLIEFYENKYSFDIVGEDGARQFIFKCNDITTSNQFKFYGNSSNTVSVEIDGTLAINKEIDFGSIKIQKRVDGIDFIG